MKPYNKSLPYFLLGFLYSAVTCIILFITNYLSVFNSDKIIMAVIIINGILMLFFVTLMFTKNNISLLKILIYSLIMLVITIIITFTFLLIWNNILLSNSSMKNFEVWENPDRKMIDLGIGIHMAFMGKMLRYSYTFIPLSTIISIFIKLTINICRKRRSSN